MKKQIVTVVVILVFVSIFVFVWKSKKNEIANVPPTDEQTSSIQGCYVATLGKDVYTLNIQREQGEAFEGTLRFKNFEKDSSNGTFAGTYKDGILLGDYTFQSEGTNSVMQVLFKKSGNSFVRGYGEVDASGTRFTDLNSITYDNSVVFEIASNCVNS